MSKIDLTQLITAEEKAAMAYERRLTVAKSECRRRILEIASEVAQINMASAVAAGLVTGHDLETYRAGLVWVDAMRENVVKIIDAENDPMNDTNWPSIPEGFCDLVARY